MSRMSNYYDVVDIAPGIKRINSSENAACDLIIGTQKAALIDTGLGLGDLPALVKSITSITNIK